MAQRIVPNDLRLIAIVIFYSLSPMQFLWNLCHLWESSLHRPKAGELVGEPSFRHNHDADIFPEQTITTSADLTFTVDGQWISSKTSLDWRCFGSVAFRLSCHTWHMLPAVCWCILVQRKLHKHLLDNIYWIKFIFLLGVKFCMNLKRDVLLDDFGWSFGEVLDGIWTISSFLCVVNLKFCRDINELFLG